MQLSLNTGKDLLKIKWWDNYDKGNEHYGSASEDRDIRMIIQVWVSERPDCPAVGGDGEMSISKVRRKDK